MWIFGLGETRRDQNKTEHNHHHYWLVDGILREEGGGTAAAATCDAPGCWLIRLPPSFLRMLIQLCFVSDFVTEKKNKRKGRWKSAGRGGGGVQVRCTWGGCGLDTRRKGEQRNGGGSGTERDGAERNTQRGERGAGPEATVPVGTRPVPVAGRRGNGNGGWVGHLCRGGGLCVPCRDLPLGLFGLFDLRTAFDWFHKFAIKYVLAVYLFRIIGINQYIFFEKKT